MLKKYEPTSRMGAPLKSARGDAQGVFASSAVKIDQVYETPVENHNPLETHATIASWSGERLTVYDATQYTAGVRHSLAQLFGLKDTDVRVVCKFTGGAFGSKGTMWQHVPIAVMAAKVVQRPVKLMLSRKQMFSGVGRRAATQQRVALGAEKDGTLKAIIHEGMSDTSIHGEFIEHFTIATPMLYACPNVSVAQTIIRVNRNIPTFMRAPGEATGVYALECAMDELAYALNMDPIELRMKNYAHEDPEQKHSFFQQSPGSLLPARC